jgi:hypothetical protein
MVWFLKAAKLLNLTRDKMLANTLEFTGAHCISNKRFTLISHSKQNCLRNANFIYVPDAILDSQICHMCFGGPHDLVFPQK